MTELEKLFERLPELPAIPKVMQELIASMNDEDADISRLADVVRHDPTLSARVLRMANSSYFGALQKVGSIHDAVTRIGLNALRTLVIASGLTTAFKAVPGITLKDFWHHALLSAGLARGLARSAHIDMEFAYTAALMHRIGSLLLHLAAPTEAAELEAANASASPAERCLAERDQIGVDHCSAGAELARIWNFPLAIRNGLAGYAYPLSPQASPYAAIVSLASLAATAVVAGQPAEDIADALPAAVMEKVVLDHETVLGVLEDAPALLEDARAFI